MEGRPVVGDLLHAQPNAVATPLARWPMATVLGTGHDNGDQCFAVGGPATTAA